jgi:putative transposase
VIDALKEHYSILALCGCLNVSKSGYYRYQSRKKEADRNQKLRERIHELFLQFDGRYGYRRICAELRRQDHLKVNHKKVYRLMSEMKLKAKIRRKRWPGPAMKKVMDPYIAENILNQNFKADSPNQKWVTDITYITIGDKRNYLSAIMDLYNNEIIAYQISDSLHTALVLDTVKEAVRRQKDVHASLILHSDRGTQYTSKDYRDLLDDLHVTPSMSRTGNCFDNACIESFFSQLKVEALYFYPIASMAEAQKIIHEYISFYNHDRAQRKLNSLTPVEYRNQAAA